MVSMLLKMSGMTILYILLTLLLKRWLKDRTLTVWQKCLVGVIFGICSILSTHFGVDYNHMMVNVRDIGPLAAGFYFNPVSGIIAGLIGGIERYIAGTCWGVGVYTTIACSVSTCLAGFLAAFLHVFMFKRRQPSAPYAFFMGAVMEVFHMYAIFLTHPDDMDMAFYVVRNCSAPMILFTAAGVSIASFLISLLSGRWKGFAYNLKKENRSISQILQFWTFIVSFIVLLGNFGFSYLMQTNAALQSAKSKLSDSASYIYNAYEDMQKMDEGVDSLARDTALTDALAIADTIDRLGGAEAATQEMLDEIRHIYGMLAVAVVDPEGQTILISGNTQLYTDLFADVLSGKVREQVEMATDQRICAGVRCTQGMVQVVFSRKKIHDKLYLKQLSRTLSDFHVGKNDSYDIVRPSGYIEIGTHSVTILTGEDRETFLSQTAGEFFESSMFNIPALCLIEPLNEQDSILVRLPIDEVYANRDIQAYESALADILLLAVLYVLISMTVQTIVVDNLLRVNRSLGKITDGDLSEVVSVGNSQEFVTLSADINATVDTLKGYITAAEHRMEQELELARAIQSSALPRTFSLPRTDFEIYALMNPAREVGGDFYDFFFVAHNRLALVIADVSGKGIPAALFMMQSKAAIRGLAETGNSPAEICFKANNALCEGNEAEMFVTVWIGIIDMETGLMKCANAGHEYPAIMRAGGEYELYKDKHGLVLAAMENMQFKEYEIQLQPGDRLFVYTDGVPEAINEQTEQYGTDRMIAELNVLKEQSEEQILSGVRQHIREFVGEEEQFDDITMLGFRYYGSSPVR